MQDNKRAPLFFASSPLTLLASKHKNHEKAGSLIEMAVLLPIILLLLIGTVNLSVWLIAHYRAASVLYEGLRFATVFSGLETGDTGARHVVVRQYIDDLLESHKLTPLSIHTEYSGPAPENDNSVSVEIRVQVPLPIPVPADRVATTVRGASAYLGSHTFLDSDDPELFIPTSPHHGGYGGSGGNNDGYGGG